MALLWLTHGRHGLFVLCNERNNVTVPVSFMSRVLQFFLTTNTMETINGCERFNGLALATYCNDCFYAGHSRKRKRGEELQSAMMGC